MRAYDQYLSLRYKGLAEVLEHHPELADRIMGTKTAYTYEYMYIEGMFYDAEQESSHVYIKTPASCRAEAGDDALSDAIDRVEATLELPTGYAFSDMRGNENQLIVLSSDGTRDGYVACLDAIVHATDVELRRQQMTRVVIQHVDGAPSPNGPVYEFECARTMPADQAKLAAMVKAERRRSNLGQTSKAVRATVRRGDTPPVRRRRRRRVQ